MIRLNLLPEEAQGRRTMVARWTSGTGEGPRQTTAPLVWLIVLPSLLLAVGVTGGIYYQDVLAPQREREAAKKNLDALSAEVADLQSRYAHLREASERYQRQVQVIDILMPPNRILWSEKFNQISQCVPDNVYLTRLQVTETVREVETAESAQAHTAWEQTPQNRRGPEPARVMVPSIVQTLNIEGISYAQQRERRIQLVLDFWNNLVNHAGVGRHGETRRFMDQFAGAPRIEYNESRDVAGVEVNAFRMVIQTVDLAQMGQASQSPPPPATEPATAQAPEGQDPTTT